jgi:hypothetical protein
MKGRGRRNKLRLNAAMHEEVWVWMGVRVGVG